ncbi:Uncharacterised protein [Mycobacteroides abscessus subsp. abscessus]|nr:Uncharacterised protein [Mycobacteroides abscessus subsp. abscessus]
MSPRPRSSWSASCTLTALPAKASSTTEPPGPQIAATDEVKPDGNATISSPGLNTPLATVPATARKSCRSVICPAPGAAAPPCGRMTYWMGKRASIRLRSDEICTCSR